MTDSMNISARRNWINGVGFGDCVELTIDGDETRKRHRKSS